MDGGEWGQVINATYIFFYGSAPPILLLSLLLLLVVVSSAQRVESRRVECDEMEWIE